MLTDCERTFLRKRLETDDADAHLLAWRESGCTDGSDQAIKVRIGRLVERADAIGFTDGERRRAGIRERARAREQAEEQQDEERERREIRLNSLELSDEVLREEAKRIKDGDRKSVQGFARLLAQIHVMTGEAGGREGLPYEEAQRRLAAARQVQPPTMVFVGPVGDTPDA